MAYSDLVDEMRYARLDLVSGRSRARALRGRLSARLRGAELVHARVQTLDGPDADGIPARSERRGFRATLMSDALRARGRPR